MCESACNDIRRSFDTPHSLGHVACGDSVEVTGIGAFNGEHGTTKRRGSGTERGHGTQATEGKHPDRMSMHGSRLCKRHIDAVRCKSPRYLFSLISLLHLTLCTVIYCMCWVSFMTAGPIKPVKMPSHDFKIAWMSMRKLLVLLSLFQRTLPKERVLYSFYFSVLMLVSQ